MLNNEKAGSFRVGMIQNESENFDIIYFETIGAHQHSSKEHSKDAQAAWDNIQKRTQRGLDFEEGAGGK